MPATKNLWMADQYGMSDLVADLYPLNGGARINSSPIVMNETIPSGIYGGAWSSEVVPSVWTTYRVRLTRTGGALYGWKLVDIMEANGDFELSNAPTALQVANRVNATISAVSLSVPSALATSTYNQDPADIAAIRGDTFDYTFGSTAKPLGTLTGWSKIRFTVKSDPANTDAQSKVQIALNASGGTNGLIILNGVGQGANLGNGAITVVDASVGIIRVVIQPVVTAGFDIASWYYDLQVNFADGRILTNPNCRRLNVIRDITQSVT